MSVAQGRLSEVVATEAAKEVIPGAQSCHLACKSTVDGRGQPEECTDQTGDFVAPDGLQL